MLVLMVLVRMLMVLAASEATGYQRRTDVFNKMVGDVSWAVVASNAAGCRQDS